MNGNNGIVPTVDLATNNGYPYPIFYGNNGYGNNGIFGGDGIWAIVLLALLFNNGGWGGFGNGNGYNNLATTDYISSEFTQRDINQLSNTTTTGFGNLSTQLCNFLTVSSSSKLLLSKLLKLLLFKSLLSSFKTT